MKRIIKTFFIALALLSAVFAFSGSAKAASWDPGRIIDDGKFTNKNAMTPADIQNFLNSKVPACDTWHAAGPGSQGAQPPWVCLKDFNENGVNAPNIIWNAAQTYGINPQVLLVTLQKENGLITDTWPYPWQYRTAMGFACPDNGTCDPAYYGFTNQVNQAARHFRNFYDQNPNWYIPFRPGVNFIQWSPNGSCGGGNVNIISRGTAALYSYTPYQPNAAALNNLYGTGDGCSAYGNRNFWRDFNNWFGSTLDGPYQWEYISQSSNKNLSNLTPGETATLTVQAKNTGNSTWYRDGANQINLATDSPQGRNSEFYDSSWLSSNTPAKLNESSVAPGQVGSFTFIIRSPNKQGNFKEYFNLIAQGSMWFNYNGLYFEINIPERYKWSFNSQGAFTDSTKTTPIDLNNMSPGQTAWMVVKGNNVGVDTWLRDGTNQVNLATYNPEGRASRFATPAWIGSNTPAKLTESSVAPGQVGTFEFPITIPIGAGSFKEYFVPIAQGATWFNSNVGQFFPITVKQDYRWSFNSQGAYTDNSKTTPLDVTKLSPGQTAWLVVKANNVGSSTWLKDTPNQVNLVTDRSGGRASRFATGAWLSNNTPAKMNETSVSPGQTATFEFPITVPAGAGSFNEYFNPLAQGIGFMNNNVGQHFPVRVSHDYRWSYNSQSAYTNSSKTTPVNLSSMLPGQTAWLVVKANNVGVATWLKDAPNQVNLATDRPGGRASRFATGAWLSNNTPAKMNETSVSPGQTATFEFPITVPAGAGTFREYFNPVAQGIMFLNNDVGQFFLINVN